MLASEWWIIAFYYNTLYIVKMKYKRRFISCEIAKLTSRLLPNVIVLKD